MYGMYGTIHACVSLCGLPLQSSQVDLCMMIDLMDLHLVMSKLMPKMRGGKSMWCDTWIRRVVCRCDRRHFILGLSKLGWKLSGYRLEVSAQKPS